MHGGIIDISSDLYKRVLTQSIWSSSTIEKSPIHPWRLKDCNVRPVATEQCGTGRLKPWMYAPAATGEAHLGESRGHALPRLKISAILALYRVEM